MQVNRIKDSRNVHSIREMVESFRDDMLSQPALTMKRPEGYQTQSYGELREIVRNLGAAIRGAACAPVTGSASSRRTAASG